MAEGNEDKHLALLLSIIIYVTASIGGSVAYNFEANESNPKSNINFDFSKTLIQNYSIKEMNQSLDEKIILEKSRKIIPEYFLNQKPEFIDNRTMMDTDSKPEEVKASSEIKWNLNGTKTVYLTSDRIMDRETDKKFLKRIKFNLQNSGINVIIDPGASHPDQVPRAVENAPKGSAVIIVNYNCAGTIDDLVKGISGPQTNGNPNKGYLYGYAKDLTGVIYVNVSPNTFLTNSSYLPRAYDDQFSPESFEGISYPAKYLLDNKIALIDSPKSDNPVMGIERADAISSQILELF